MIASPTGGRRGRGRGSIRLVDRAGLVRGVAMEGGGWMEPLLALEMLGARPERAGCVPSPSTLPTVFPLPHISLAHLGSLRNLVARASADRDTAVYNGGLRET